MDLQSLVDMGVPGWVIIIAVLTLILDRVGAFRFAFGHLKSQNQLEREQAEFERQQEEARAAADQSEQIALWSQMTQFATKSLNTQEILLEYVINTSSNWHNKHTEELAEIAKGQQQLLLEIRSLATRISKHDKREVDA